MKLEQIKVNIKFEFERLKRDVEHDLSEYHSLEPEQCEFEIQKGFKESYVRVKVEDDFLLSYNLKDYYKIEI